MYPFESVKIGMVGKQKQDNKARVQKFSVASLIFKPKRFALHRVNDKKWKYCGNRAPVGNGPNESVCTFILAYPCPEMFP